MKHLILTVSLITATCSAQAAEQRDFLNGEECREYSDAVWAASVRRDLHAELQYRAKYRIEYKDKILSFRCWPTEAHVLIESRQEFQDRTKREELAWNAKQEADRQLQRKKADLLIGK